MDPRILDYVRTVYTTLLHAEDDYLTKATAITYDLSAPILREVMAVRRRWIEATVEAAEASCFLAQTAQEPVQWVAWFGHALVDRLDHRPAPRAWPPGEGDLALTPDGQLWTCDADADLGMSLRTPESHHLSELLRRGAVALSYECRRPLVEEALASRFPIGSPVVRAGDAHPIGVVSRPPYWAPVSAQSGCEHFTEDGYEIPTACDDVDQPWISTQDLPQDVVYVSGGPLGDHWWDARLIRPGT
ncbi:hypothetical protein [Nocardiopsis synnemataformans]|uniref:hypothetical protein n=1 Tax=Nocardiopsis synnemataformans TaxID=61305 RepID=UPI003EBBE1DE